MSPHAHELQALLFDFDGTIAETERSGHRVAYNAAFAEFGLEWKWDDGLYGDLLAVGGGKERISHYIDRYRSHDVPADRAALIGALHERKQRIFATLVNTIAFRPGVLRVVREARAAGIRLAIATTAARAGVDAMLAREPGLLEAFELIAAGDVVSQKKPAPDIYRYALDRLGIAPSCCVAIEDAAIGVRASIAAGLVTLVTPSDYTRDEDFNGASAVLSDFGEPERPAHVLRGPSPAHGFVDIAYFRELLQINKSAEQQN